MRVYIESKLLNPIKKIAKDIAQKELPVLDLEFSRTTRHHQKGKIYRAEANLTIGKKMLRAEVEEGDIRLCCDILKEELERVIVDFKNRSRSIVRRGAREVKDKFRFSRAAKFG